MHGEPKHTRNRVVIPRSTHKDSKGVDPNSDQYHHVDLDDSVDIANTLRIGHSYSRDDIKAKELVMVQDVDEPYNTLDPH